MQKYIHYEKWTGEITGHTLKKSDSCIEANEKGLSLFTAKGNCSNSPFDDKKQIDGLTTAYVCDDFVCKLPVTDVGMLDKLLF